MKAFLARMKAISSKELRHMLRARRDAALAGLGDIVDAQAHVVARPDEGRRLDQHLVLQAGDEVGGIAADHHIRVIAGHMSPPTVARSISRLCSSGRRRK